MEDIFIKRERRVTTIDEVVGRWNNAIGECEVRGDHWMSFI